MRHVYQQHILCPESTCIPHPCLWIFPTAVAVNLSMRSKTAAQTSMQLICCVSRGHAWRPGDAVTSSLSWVCLPVCTGNLYVSLHDIAAQISLVCHAPYRPRPSCLLETPNEALLLVSSRAGPLQPRLRKEVRGNASGDCLPGACRQGSPEQAAVLPFVSS
jgi:hypothetical protein